MTCTTQQGYRQSAQSLRYIYFQVEDLIAGADPTGDPVAVALMPAPTFAAPAPADFKVAGWFTDTIVKGTPARPVYYARVLVGPGGAITPTAGTYMAWLRITDNPEIPADPAGLVIIT